MKKQKYIVRIDFKNTHGYNVRFCINSSKVTDSKMFSDSVWGGKRKALKAAIEWRDQMAEFFHLDTSQPYRKQGPHRRNRKNGSGIIGVHFDYTEKKGNIYYVWIASYSINKKQRHSVYSVNKYGDCEAFRLACKKRFEMSGPLKVYRNSNFPCRLPAINYHYID